MKLKIFTVVVLPISLLATALWAQSPRFSRLELTRSCDCERQTSVVEAAQTNLSARMSPAFFSFDTLAPVPAPRERSVGKAFLFSAVIPGTGEFYNKSFLKGLVFLGLEAGAWAMYGVYTQRGNEKEDAFIAYAQAHWSEDKYWASLAQLSGCDANNRPCLRDYESKTFSHFLPAERNQTYYENIGKYDQFNAGWDDSKSGQALRRDSDNRELYTRMRKKANDQYKLATWGVSIVLVNHVISALDAAYTTYKFNREIKASMGMEMQRYDLEIVPALVLKMSW